MRQVKVGVIGCGMIAQVMHLPHIAELEQWDLAAICDVSPGLLAHTAARHPGAKAYADYQDLVADPTVEAVMVLTRHHAEPALAALRAGKHTFIEKPMAVSLQEADAIVEAAAASGVKAMVGYHKRYDPGYLAGLQEIEQAKGIRLIRLNDVIGPNDMFLAHYDIASYQDVSQSVIADGQAKMAAAMQDALGDVPAPVRAAYGLMLGLSTHDMTVLRGAFGQAERVVSTEIWGGGRYYSAVIEFADDVRCVFYTGIVQHRIFDEEMIVYAADRTVAINFPSPFIKNAPTMVTVREMADGMLCERRIEASYEEAFKRELVHWHDCIVNDREPRTGVHEGRADTALLIEMAKACTAR